MFSRAQVLLYLIMFCGLLGCARKPQTDSNLSEQETKVKTVLIYKGEELSASQHYDEQGRVVEKINNPDVYFQKGGCIGDTNFITHYRYKNNVLAKTVIVDYCNGEVIDSTVTDELNPPTNSDTIFGNDGEPLEWTETVTAVGLKITKLYVTEEGCVKTDSILLDQ